MLHALYNAGPSRWENAFPTRRNLYGKTTLSWATFLTQDPTLSLLETEPCCLLQHVPIQTGFPTNPSSRDLFILFFFFFLRCSGWCAPPCFFLGITQRLTKLVCFIGKTFPEQLLRAGGRGRSPAEMPQHQGMPNFPLHQQPKSFPTGPEPHPGWWKGPARAFPVPAAVGLRAPSPRAAAPSARLPFHNAGLGFYYEFQTMKVCLRSVPGLPMV